MKIFFRNLLIAIAALGFAASHAPAFAKKKQPELTPLELQALQSREFEVSKENLFGAVMTVVQDLGYQVQSADVQTGLITATSAVEQKTSFFEALGGGRSSAITRMTAYIQNLPNGMSRVRLNFMYSKTSQGLYGQASQQDKPILDAVVYRNAWDKIDEALFVFGAMEPSVAPQSSSSQPAPIENKAGDATVEAGTSKTATN